MTISRCLLVRLGASTGLLLLFVAALAACQSAATGSSPVTLSGSAAPLLIEFQRTACFGPCPVDVLTVYANGRLRYEGQAHTSRQGSYTSQLTQAELQSLLQTFEAASFFDFATSYKTNRKDLPTYYLTLAVAGRRHKVADYGSRPPALKALEDKLADLIETTNWQPQ